MPRNRRDGAALLRVVRRDPDIVLRDRADDRFLAHEWLGHEGRALDHLAHVICEGFGKAVMYARACREIDIAAATRDDHVRAHVEELEKRVHTRDRDDAGCLVHLLLDQTREAAEAREVLAAVQLLS